MTVLYPALHLPPAQKRLLSSQCLFGERAEALKSPGAYRLADEGRELLEILPPVRRERIKSADRGYFRTRLGLGVESNDAIGQAPNHVQIDAIPNEELVHRPRSRQPPHMHGILNRLAVASE